VAFTTLNPVWAGAHGFEFELKDLKMKSLKAGQGSRPPNLEYTS
jgi:hypothetical protein